MRDGLLVVGTWAAVLGVGSLAALGVISVTVMVLAILCGGALIYWLVM